MQSRYLAKQKKKKTWIIWLLSILGAVLLGAATYWLYLHDWDPEESWNKLVEQIQSAQDDTAEPANNAEEVVKPEETLLPEDDGEPVPELPEEEPAEEIIDATRYPEGIELPAEPTVINDILLANKQHPLPSTYAPGESPEARTAFEAMKKEAAAAGIDLAAFSTYRDFGRQKVLYDGYVAKDGQEAADRYSARPGFSEHQTGLAFDIGEVGQEVHWAASSFGDTPGGKWLAENAHRFGFILRYPEGKEQLTGYMHESWHFRFVGTEVAKIIFEQKMTLEEYLGVIQAS